MQTGSLLLFDIDGTLLATLPAHGQAMDRALREVFGVGASIDDYNWQGRTDCEIMSDLARLQGVSEERILANMPKCAEIAISDFARHIESLPVQTLPEVLETVKTLHKAGRLLGLITGNLEPIGRAKLTRVGMNQYFPVGGFGSDHQRRAELVRIAADRARESLGFAAEGVVYVIGDTPKDVAAGREAGAKTIGVATGSYSEDELRACGADFVIGCMAEMLNIGI